MKTVVLKHYGFLGLSLFMIVRTLCLLELLSDETGKQIASVVFGVTVGIWIHEVLIEKKVATVSGKS